MKTIIFGKRVNIDPVMTIIIGMLILLGFNYYTKYIMTESKTSSRDEIVKFAKFKRICIEQHGITECFELDNVVYRIVIQSNSETNLSDLLLTKK